MGRRGSKQYNAIYAYIKSTFEKNYPKEIDQLTTRFQAEQLAYQNERDRHLSMRYYTIGIILCVVLLLVFSFFSWKKIFRLRLSKRKLEVMTRKAENAIKRKNLFLSNMSHEVRTPLNAIVGFSGLLASEDMDLDAASEKEYCEIIKVNSQQLLNLVNDILDFSDLKEKI
ncbi:MAG: sensor histidine kinase [Odoribacter splanchnicus]